MPEKRPCPYCKKPARWENNPWRPFCSERCKMTDLGLWAMGEYKIAGEKISKESMEEGKEKEVGNWEQLAGSKEERQDEKERK